MFREEQLVVAFPLGYKTKQFGMKITFLSVNGISFFSLEKERKKKKKLAHNIDVVVIIVGFLPSLQKEKRERKKTRKIINKCFFHV